MYSSKSKLLFKYSTIFLFVTASTLVKGQDYKKFIREDAHWRVYYYETQFPDTVKYQDIWTYQFRGDTTINDTLYHKLYRKTLRSINNDYQEPYYTYPDSILSAVLREDTITQMVYGIILESELNFCPFPELGERLFYDFSKQLKDSLQQCNISYFYETINAIAPNPEYPDFNAYYSYGDILYTQAIGGFSGPVGFIGIGGGWGYILDQYCIGTPEECGIISDIAEQTPFIVEAYPNPFTNTISLNSYQRIATVAVYNAQGQLLKSEFDNFNGKLIINEAPGLYLVQISNYYNKQFYLKLIKL